MWSKYVLIRASLFSVLVKNWIRWLVAGLSHKCCRGGKSKTPFLTRYSWSMSSNCGSFFQRQFPGVKLPSVLEVSEVVCCGLGSVVSFTASLRMLRYSRSCSSWRGLRRSEGSETEECSGSWGWGDWCGVTSWLSNTTWPAVLGIYQESIAVLEHRSSKEKVKNRSSQNNFGYVKHTLKWFGEPCIVFLEARLRQHALQEPISTLRTTNLTRLFRTGNTQSLGDCLLVQLLQGRPTTAASHLTLRVRQGIHVLLDLVAAFLVSPIISREVEVYSDGRLRLFALT